MGLKCEVSPVNYPHQTLHSCHPEAKVVVMLIWMLLGAHNFRGEFSNFARKRREYGTTKGIVMKGKGIPKRKRKHWKKEKSGGKGWVAVGWPRSSCRRCYSVGCLPWRGWNDSLPKAQAWQTAVTVKALIFRQQKTPTTSFSFLFCLSTTLPWSLTFDAHLITSKVSGRPLSFRH